MNSWDPAAPPEEESTKRLNTQALAGRWVLLWRYHHLGTQPPSSLALSTALAEDQGRFMSAAYKGGSQSLWQSRTEGPAVLGSLCSRLVMSSDGFINPKGSDCHVGYGEMTCGGMKT